MGTVRNISADPRNVPLLGRHVDVDEVLEVSDELLDPEAHFWDPEVWVVELSAADSRTVVELKAELESRGLSVSGTKSDLIERLAAADGE